MKISVVIPVFNRLRPLERAVGSVLGQSTGDYELIVVDDASTEDLSRCRRLVEGSGHRWISLPSNLGPAGARNAGADVADGDWIAFLDSDDIWLPRKLERQIDWHGRHPGIRISQCEDTWFRNGQPVRKPTAWRQPPTGRVFEACVQRCLIGPSCVMMERALFHDLGGFDASYPVCEDYELWLRLTLRETVGLVEGGPLVEKHAGEPDQLSVTTPAMDRFRVRALQSLLRSEDLSSADSRVVLEALTEKAEILAKGAVKHCPGEVEHYREIARRARASEQ
jgi:glycosyltransferase involved in cell wall biosynthesis